MSEFENLTVKKIPKAVLKKCEWGHDDYSLEIKNLPAPLPTEAAALAAEEIDQSTSGKARKPARKFGKGKGKDRPYSTWMKQTRRETYNHG